MAGLEAHLSDKEGGNGIRVECLEVIWRKFLSWQSCFENKLRKNDRPVCFVFIPKALNSGRNCTDRISDSRNTPTPHPDTLTPRADGQLSARVCGRSFSGVSQTVGTSCCLSATFQTTGHVESADSWWVKSLWLFVSTSESLHGREMEVTKSRGHTQIAHDIYPSHTLIFWKQRGPTGVGCYKTILHEEWQIVHSICNSL